MRFRLRVWLPITQLAIAVALTISNRMREDRIGNPSWIKFDRQICDSLNGPATIVRVCLVRLSAHAFPEISWVNFILETIVYFALIVVLWYLVAVEISVKGKQGLSALTSRTRMRAIADMLLVAFGVVLAVFGKLVRQEFGGIPTAYANLVAAPYFVWAIGLISFYAHDLWASRKTQSVGLEADQ